MSQETPEVETYLHDLEAFHHRAQRLGLGDLSPYIWYHTVELPYDLITPGLFDFRSSLPCFHFPEDMRGLHVLDVGSATGFFTFEFEKRGARVVCIELPSLDTLDRFPGQTLENTTGKIKGMIAPQSMGTWGDKVRRYTADELHHYLLRAPFELCHTLLHSKVERSFASVVELSHVDLGVSKFDLVFMGDVLLHTLNPVETLAAVAPLCRGALVLSQDIPEAQEGQPAMIYLGGEEPIADQLAWWLPNKPCLVQVLKKLGFREVRETGHHTGVQRPFGYRYDRTVLYAAK